MANNHNMSPRRSRVWHFLLGFGTCVGIQMLVFDHLGKEGSIRWLADSWVDLPPSVGALVVITCLLSHLTHRSE